MGHPPLSWGPHLSPIDGCRRRTLRDNAAGRRISLLTVIIVYPSSDLVFCLEMLLHPHPMPRLSLDCGMHCIGSPLTSSRGVGPAALFWSTPNRLRPPSATTENGHRT